MVFRSLFRRSARTQDSTASDTSTHTHTHTHPYTHSYFYSTRARARGKDRVTTVAQGENIRPGRSITIRRRAQSSTSHTNGSSCTSRIRQVRASQYTFTKPRRPTLKPGYKLRTSVCLSRRTTGFHGTKTLTHSMYESPPSPTNKPPSFV